MKNFPIVDLTAISNHLDRSPTEQELTKLAKDFYEALSGDGFAYLVNHGIPMDKVGNVFTESIKFFNLPQDQKLKYKKAEESFHFQGYAAGKALPTKMHEMREMFDIWGPQDQWQFPNDEVPEFKTSMDSLQSELSQLGAKILVMLAKALDLKDHELFLKAHEGIHAGKLDYGALGDRESLVTYRSLYYPPISKDFEAPKGAIRCREHTDYGTATLIFQDHVGGLEVRRADGSWILAPPIPGSLLINTSDLLEVWSGGRFPACIHRVPIPPKDERAEVGRQSISYFLYPDTNTIITPQVSQPFKKFADFPPINSSDYYKAPWNFNFSFNPKPEALVG